MLNAVQTDQRVDRLKKGSTSTEGGSVVRAVMEKQALSDPFEPHKRVTRTGPESTCYSRYKFNAVGQAPCPGDDTFLVR